MSQPQTQPKPSMISGLNHRRGDRDLGNRSESVRNEYHKYRPSRSGLNNDTSTERFVHPVHQQNDDNSHVNNSSQSVTTTAKISEDKTEVFSQGESRNGDSDTLLCLTACLIGQLVEVQVKNGSVYSGIFHTANAEKDYGIVLRMAQLIRHGSSKGGKTGSAKDLGKRPIKTLIIYASDLVQIIAKDVPLGGECLQNGKSRENRAEIVTDSFLSQGRHREIERELKPWTPDKDDPKELGLESTFQNTWNRNWDQFEINKTLFGVESTFDEELYTTKLERGPQMRERERDAWRIAREIEGQSTRNLHLAEERGMALSKEFELLDEESKYSSVLRASEDSGDDNDDSSMNLLNNMTFGNSAAELDTVAVGSNETEPYPNNMAEGNTQSPSLSKLKDGSTEGGSSPSEQEPSADPMESNRAGGDSVRISLKNITSQKVGGFHAPVVSPRIGDTTSIQALNLDAGFPQVTEDVYREFNEFKLQENAKRGKKLREDQVNELKSFSESLRDLPVMQHTPAPSGNARKMASEYAPPASSLPVPTSVTSMISPISGSDCTTLGTTQSHLSSSDKNIESTRIEAGETQIETPSTSGAYSARTEVTEISLSSGNSATSTPHPTSPSSSSSVSTSVDSSKKMSLNPNAKEFKLNANAKSFTPNFTPLRPPSPVLQGPVYVPGMIPPVSPIQTMPAGVNPLLQTAARYPPYSPGAPPYIPSPTVYTPVSGAPVIVGGQTSMKALPQLQQPAQQTVRYTSPVSPAQAASTYVHPTGQLYPQQMMFCQPGQVAYFHPYMQGPMPPPQPIHTGQQTQPRHRAVQGMQLYVPPPFIPGQGQQQQQQQQQQPQPFGAPLQPQ